MVCTIKSNNHISKKVIMESKIITEREQRRFAPQIGLEGIDVAGQEKIKQSRILVIGSGGKGTSAMQALISAGVGYLGVSDDTLIDEETLSRQSLYNDRDIGKQKAIVTKQYLQSRNTLTEIKVHNIRLTAQNLNKVVENYNLIIDATNNFESHYAISHSAQESKKPLIFSHIENNIGYLFSFHSGFEGELKSVLPDPDTLKKDRDIDTPVILVNSTTGAMLANEALKIILDKPSQIESNLLKIKLSDYTLSFAP